MADIIWGKTYSTTQYFAFRLGLLVEPTITDANVTFKVEVWFWSQYALSDASVNLFYRVGENITTAYDDKFLVKKPSVYCYGNIDGGWSNENKVKLYSTTHTYARELTKKTVEFYAHVGGIYNYSTASGGLITAHCSGTVNPRATYTITFDANGGTGAPAPVTAFENQVTKLPTAVPKRKGYNFLGWSNAATDTKAKYAAGSTFVGSGRITLYAVWADAEFTNTTEHWLEGFVNGEGNNNRCDSVAFLSYNHYSDPECEFKKVHGESFVLEEMQAQKVPNGFELVHVNTSGLDGAYKAYEPCTKVTQPGNVVSLEYYYQPIKYAIKYNLDGGTFPDGEPPAMYSVLYGVTFPVPYKEGCEFRGWYDQEGNLVDGVNIDAIGTFNELKKECANELLKELADRSVGNITLTAKWSIDGAAYVKCDGEMKKGLPWVKSGSKWKRGVPWCKTADGWRKGGL